MIVGDTGGLREIVSDGHGLSFPPQDADELADRMIAVLSDADLAADLVDKGRRRIQQRYDWQTVALRTTRVYERAIEEEAALGGPEERPALRDLLRAAPILELGGAAS